MRKAVLFDMDGVITDTEKYYVEAMCICLKENGRDVQPNEITDLCGCAQIRFWTILKERFDLDGKTEDYVDRTHELRDWLIETKGLWPMPGVIELIRTLHKAGIPLAVASSAPLYTIRGNMERLGIAECFQTMVSGLECEHGKPAPDIFLLAAERLGMEPAECVVIEDSGNGVNAAKAGGIYCLAYVPPEAYPQDVSKADHKITDFTGLGVEDILG